MVVLDTSVIIDHLRQGKKGTSVFLQLTQKHLKEKLAISIIAVQELYGGRSTIEPEVEKIILAFVASLSTLPYTFEVAKLAGEIARDLDRPIEFADAAIAATTILSGGKLFTLNGKDFAGIENLVFYTL